MKKNIHQSKILFLPIFIVMWFCVPLIHAQSDGEYGTTSNLSYGAGARAMGLGRAYVAVANDPSAVFWNPAGLELVPRKTFSLFHNQVFEGTTYDFLGFVYPTLTYGTVGFGFARLGTGEIPFTDANNVNLGELNYDESEIYFSYGKKLPYNLYGGGTFKFRRQHFSNIDQDASGFGLDIGVMYQPEWESNVLKNLAFGLSLRNLVAPNLKLGTETDIAPYHFTFGLKKGLVVGEGGKLNILMDFHKSKLQSTAIHTGTEYVFRNLGTIRVGFDNSHLAFGAGVNYSFVHIDYSFGSISSESEFPPTHRFSITFDIGKSRRELLAIAEKERRQREKELVERTVEQEKRQFIAEHMEKGHDYMEEGKYFDAYVEFQQVVSEDPFNKQANVLMDSANTKIQQDLAQRQEKAITEAVDKELAEENKKFVQNHFEKGQIYLQNNRFTDALTEFNLALERAPNDPTILEAIETAERQLEEQVRKLVAEGRQEFQRGNYSSALQILSDALVLAPEDPQLNEEINTLANRIKIQQYIQEALQYYDMGELQQALSLFEEALEMDPSNERLKMYIERTKRGMGGVEEQMDQESERKYLRGIDLFLAGKYEEALKLWRELEEQYPYNKKLLNSIKSAEDRLKQTRD